MHSKTVIMLLCVVLLAACNESAPTKRAEAPDKPPESAVPPEISSVAQTLLGSEAEVILFGDLAHTGQQQVLAVNRLPKTPEGTVPGILVTRAVLAMNDGGKWKEALRCDEHLKNPEGFLGGTPIVAVAGWRMQYEQNAQKGLLLFFTPLEQAASAHPPTIGVRWNPQWKRYQSLDRNYEHFLSEVPSLERPKSTLR
jgi:hypothetical protein